MLMGLRVEGRGLLEDEDDEDDDDDGGDDDDDDDENHDDDHHAAAAADDDDDHHHHDDDELNHNIKHSAHNIDASLNPCDAVFVGGRRASTRNVPSTSSPARRGPPASPATRRGRWP